MRQRMNVPISRPRPTNVVPKGTVVGVFKMGGKDGRPRTYKFLATGEPWQTVSLPHIMKRPGQAVRRVNGVAQEPVSTDDGYHYLPTKKVLVSIG